MAGRVRLNERAATKRPDTLWHVDEGWALFAGPLGRNAQHAHSTAVYLAGLYDSFRLRVADEAWRTCRAAVIRAGTPYEFDAGGGPLGVLYLEPNRGRADALAGLVTEGEEMRGALVGDGDTAHIRALFEHRSDADEVRAGADDLLAFSRRRQRRDIDPRVARAVDVLQASDELLPVDEVAAAAGLSSSRFQHLFTAEVGVPFRRYRGWRRLRSAIRTAAGGTSLTDAAYAAGFADQAHFSRAFRAAFGAPPSRGL
jgi:AraC-like DNA-binding protein